MLKPSPSGRDRHDITLSLCCPPSPSSLPSLHPFHPPFLHFFLPPSLPPSDPFPSLSFCSSSSRTHVCMCTHVLACGYTCVCCLCMWTICEDTCVRMALCVDVYMRQYSDHPPPRSFVAGIPTHQRASARHCAHARTHSPINPHAPHAGGRGVDMAVFAGRLRTHTVRPSL